MDKSANPEQRPSVSSNHRHQIVALCFVLAVVLIVATIQIHNVPSNAVPVNPSRVPVVIDINQATVEELQLLPGVGEKLAGDIVSYRDEIGAFKALDELMNVRGIKTARFEQISPYLVISAAADVTADAAGSQR